MRRGTLGTGMMAPLSMANNFHGDYYAGPSGAAIGALMAGQAIGDAFRDMGASAGQRQELERVQGEKDRLRMDDLNQRGAVYQALNPGVQMQSANGMSNRDMTRKMAMPDAGTQMSLYKLQEDQSAKKQKVMDDKFSSVATYWYLNGGPQSDPDGSNFKKMTGSTRSPFEYIPEAVFNAAENRNMRLQLAEDSNNTRRDLAAMVAATKQGDGGGGAKLSDVNTTRSAFMRDSGTFIAQRDGFSRVVNGANEDNAVGDLKVIFGYMKLLDPTSVVREGEFANAENAQGVPDKIRNAYNKVMEGERLTEDQRGKFVSSAYNEYKGAKSNHSNITKSYDSLSRKYGVDPVDIIPDLYSETDALWDKFSKPKIIRTKGSGMAEHPVPQGFEELP